MYVFAIAAAVYITGTSLIFHREIFENRYRKIVWDYYPGRRGNRTLISRDEFFRRRPTEDERSAFFHFDDSPNRSNSVLLKPLWTCSAENITDETHENGERKRKLIFLSIPRTAGSTIRALLKAYAQSCHVGFAAVNRCFDLNFHQMNSTEEWRNGRDSHAAGQYCVLTHLSNRIDETRNRATNISTALLQEMQVDILSGQLPVGSDEFWHTIDSAGNQVPADALFVAFFRQPLFKFVSEFMFQMSASDDLSVERSVGLIRDAVVHATSEGRYFEQYLTYLITPRQKEWVENEGVRWTPERRVNITLTNLRKLKVLIGIVERMPESLELLQSIVDKGKELNSLFQFFSSTDKTENLANIASRNLTNAIVEKLREDAPIMESIEEFLKYDVQIYKLALQIHQEQYRSRVEGTPVLDSQSTDEA